MSWRFHHRKVVVMYGVFIVVFVIGLIVGSGWLLARALNGDQAPEAGGSFGDLALGDKNTRKKRRSRKGDKPAP